MPRFSNNNSSKFTVIKTLEFTTKPCIFGTTKSYEFAKVFPISKVILIPDNLGIETVKFSGLSSDRLIETTSPNAIRRKFCSRLTNKGWSSAEIFVSHESELFFKMNERNNACI